MTPSQLQVVRQDSAFGLVLRMPPTPHSLSLQELLLLPVGLYQLLGDQLHQLQAVLDLHQDVKVLPAPHLHGTQVPRRSWGLLTRSTRNRT